MGMLIGAQRLQPRSTLYMTTPSPRHPGTQALQRQDVRQVGITKNCMPTHKQGKEAGNKAATTALSHAHVCVQCRHVFYSARGLVQMHTQEKKAGENAAKEQAAAAKARAEADVRASYREKLSEVDQN
eukprot:scaffold211978_cov15-Tisochrysis_lutea.AAC.1